MLKQYLEDYKKNNNKIWEEVAHEIGITRQTLDKVIRFRSPHTTLITCLKIEKFTHLKPWEYLDGLDQLKQLYEKTEET